MEEQRILEELKIVPLLTKIVRGEDLTVLEEKTVDVWLSQSSSNRAFFEQLKDKEHVARELLKRDAVAATTSEELKKLHSLINKNRPAAMRRYWLSAAAIIFAVSVSVFLYRYFQTSSPAQNHSVTANMVQDIEPGKEQATLTFGDGQVIDLEGKTVKTDADGVTYINGEAISPSKSQYATLTTPRKGQYKAVLPDGTTVWLNAESKLKYPTQFSGAERLVQLEGEGYFEVTHNASKPFIVESQTQRVQVLGTKFNVNSYANEEFTTTTLISGSVELRSSKDKVLVRLKPGEQGQFAPGSISVSKVDTEPFIAWTANEFQFKGVALAEVLRQLERWYDIEVDYKNIPSTKVHATISRDKKLNSVLYALAEITELHFKMRGRRIEIEE